MFCNDDIISSNSDSEIVVVDCGLLFNKMVATFSLFWEFKNVVNSSDWFIFVVWFGKVTIFVCWELIIFDEFNCIIDAVCCLMVFPAVAVVGFARVIIFGLLTTILLCGDIILWQPLRRRTR